MTAFEIHKNVCTDQLWHLDFRVGVAEMMIWENYEAHRVWLGNPTTPTPEQIRLDQIYHTLVPTSQGYGMYCNTRLMCLKCDKWMQKKVCHGLYHSKQDFLKQFNFSLMNSWIFWILTTV